MGSTGNLQFTSYNSTAVNNGWPWYDDVFALVPDDACASSARQYTTGGTVDQGNGTWLSPVNHTNQYHFLALSGANAIPLGSKITAITVTVTGYFYTWCDYGPTSQPENVTWDVYLTHPSSGSTGWLSAPIDQAPSTVTLGGTLWGKTWSRDDIVGMSLDFRASFQERNYDGPGIIALQWEFWVDAVVVSINYEPPGMLLVF